MVLNNGRKVLAMTHVELHAHAAAVCCICDHVVAGQDYQDLSGLMDESLYGEVYCHVCLGEHLQLCRECSGRYTADGICGECAAKEYALAV